MEQSTYENEVDEEFLQEDESTIPTKPVRANSCAICDQCGKDFTNVYTLRAHKNQIHEGIKAYACNICNTRFATKFKLKRHHLGVHSDKRDYHCESCGHSFKTRDMLIKHQRTHFTGPFSCHLCCDDQVFKFKSGLDHHMLLKHSVKTQVVREKSNIFYKCSLCEKLYKTLKMLERHEQSHYNNCNDDEPVKKCLEQNCTTKAFKKQEKKRHDNDDLSLTCQYCRKTYKTASNFEIHLASHEKENSMIDYEYVIDDETQNEAFYEEQDETSLEIAGDEEVAASGIPQDLMRNIDESMVMVERFETKRFVCDVEVIEELEPEQLEDTEIITDKSPDECFAEYDETESYLIEHDEGIDFYDTIITEELEPSDELEEMNQEGSHFIEDTSTVMIENVVTTETQSKPNKKNRSNNERSVCDECGAKFKNNSHLRRHVQRKHRKDSHKLECSICGSKFLLNYDLRRHMIKHTSNRDYLCKICQQRFKTEISLKNHIKIVHSQDRPSERRFKCKDCDRSYFHQRHLDYHTRKHTGDAKFSCELCTPEKRFYYSDAIKWHKIRHHKEPAPFNCGVCGKKFIHGKSLESHSKEHVGESGSLAVSCSICQKLVSEKRHLKRHMRSHVGKGFLCSCGESFKENHQLTKHSKNCAQLMKDDSFHDEIYGS